MQTIQTGRTGQTSSHARLPFVTGIVPVVAKAPARVVSWHNRDMFQEQRLQMHAARKQVFVDQWQWDLQVSEGLYEIDEYDRDDSIYLIVLDARGTGHLGSVRLLPTDGPHLLADKFAGLCAAGVPRGPDIFEITRLVTRPGLARDQALRVRRLLSLAIIEFALANGVRHFTMMTHMAYLASVLAAGWDCEPLGLPVDMGGVAVAALRINVDAATLGRLQAEWNLVGPALAFDLTQSAVSV